jgi:formylmethanofuran dehydrogenase subunit E
MNKVIQLLESTRQKQVDALKQLPKMVDKHIETVAVEGEKFIKEIDQALLVLSNVVGRSEQLKCEKCGAKFVPHLMKPLTICDKCADSFAL